MSGKQYLKNQLPVLLLNLLGVLALALFLIATGTSRQAISLIALVWIVVVVCYLTVSFFIQKRHCETLLVMAEQLGEKYLMPEVSIRKKIIPSVRYGLEMWSMMQSQTVNTYYAKTM